MKKTLPSLVFLGSACLLAPNAFSDTIFGIYAGAGTWKAEFDGDLGSATNQVSVSDLGYDSEQNTFLWVAVEHPVPLLPNIKLVSTELKSSGSGTITQSYTLGNTTYTAGTALDSEFDLSHIDGTLYYEILDNWVTADIGITARMFDGYAEATEAGSGTSESDFSGVMPMLYAHAKFELPFTGWFIAGTGNIVSYQGDNATDLNASVGYFSDGLIALDIGFNVGYRTFSIKADELDDLFVDVDQSGPYAEFIVHF